MTSAVLVVLVFVPMLVEARRAAQNERALRARGGIEPDGDVYNVMRIAYPASFLMMILEGVMRGGPPRPVLAAGCGLWLAAKALKWWAIESLGLFWTFRVVIVPGAALVASGPYRFMRHPVYVAVAGELIGVTLMSGALIAGPIATAAFLLLVMRRIAVEDAALDAILRRH